MTEKDYGGSMARQKRKNVEKTGKEKEDVPMFLKKIKQ